MLHRCEGCPFLSGRCSRCGVRLHANDTGAICLSCKLYVYLWRLGNHDKKLRHGKTYWVKHSVKLITKKIAWQKTEHGKRIRARLNRDSNIRLRTEMIAAYGGECSCCGENHPEFLALDHLNGGGREERERCGGTQGILRRLKREGWPKDAYTVLCHNCNMAKQFYGNCPHLQERQAACVA